MYRMVHGPLVIVVTIISKEYFIISGNSITIVMVVVQSVLQSTSLSSEKSNIIVAMLFDQVRKRASQRLFSGTRDYIEHRNAKRCATRNFFFLFLFSFSNLGTSSRVSFFLSRNTKCYKKLEDSSQVQHKGLKPI